MQPWEHSRASRLAGPVGLGALTLVGLVVLSCYGLPSGLAAYLGPISVGTSVLGAGPIALAYLLGGFGLGRPLASWLARESPNRFWIQLGLGAGVMLWVSHLIGMAGLLSGVGPMPRVVGWGVVGLGILLVADQVIRGPLRPERWPVVTPAIVLLGPALAVLLVAASNPPGMLWHGTEHGAFDALEYHLQLPKEWAAGERLWPSEHNVYSFLPSFVEAGYMHLGAMMPGSSDPVMRMVAGSGGEGHWFLACQFLHVGLAMIGAMLVARAGWAIAVRCGVESAAAAWIGVIAGALLLSTPWMIVVSSLPYNEAGLIAMAAAGVLVAIDEKSSAWARGVGAGWAVGVACGCKPTAMFMVGPMVGLLLLGTVAARQWPRVIVGGALAGIMAVWPWMLRNWMASDNPVFPFASSVFKSSWWTDEQLERFARNHHVPPGTGIGERFGRLVSGTYGLMHEQWGGGGTFVVILIAAAAGALWWKSSRRLGVLLALGLLSQVVCWMTLTHLQSRFLIPLLVPVAMLLALGGAALTSWVGRASPNRRAMTIGAVGVLAIAPLAQMLGSVLLFLEQNDMKPNTMLVVGPGAMTGMGAEGDFVTSSPESQERFLAAVGPSAFINLTVRPWEGENRGVYLLGDSTPLYFMGRAWMGSDDGRRPGSPIAYHATWDRTPIIGGMEVSQWSMKLHEAGFRFVLVNYDELKRLIETDHNYDPQVTMEMVMRWIDDRGSKLRSIRAWRMPGGAERTGSELFLVDIPFAEVGGHDGTMGRWEGWGDE
jgi:MFS family permease